jgi:regulator of sigma E protease
LEIGDRIVAVNDQPITYFDEFQNIVQENKGEQIKLTVLRDSQELNLTSEVDTAGIVGLEANMEIDLARQTYNLGESLDLGIERAFGSLWANIKGFGTVISRWIDGNANLGKSVKGPLGIADIYGGEWIWAKFWSITAILSMWLAFVNFLPIPALDGGHVMFLSYEMISGSKPSDKFMEVAQKVGMAIVFTLMILVIGNDIFQKIFG